MPTRHVRTDHAQAVILAFALLLGIGGCSAGTEPLPASVTPGETLSGDPALVIAHRGSSGLYPEHTLVAYRAAIDAGADYIEPDLVMTRDGALVARHERHLSETTDVSTRPEFADRQALKRVGPSLKRDWFVEDFTLEELKTLRARQPRSTRPSRHDDRHEIPTFGEVLDLARQAAEAGRPVGVYPELKDALYYQGLGQDMPAAVIAAIRKAGLAEAGVPLLVQSFEPQILRRLDRETDWRLVQLLPVTSGPSLAFEDIATYAEGIGPWKLLVAQSGEGPRAYVAGAHAAGLFVHPYTFRDDELGAGYTTIEAELRDAFDWGVDGIFTDFPKTALRVRAARETERAAAGE